MQEYEQIMEEARALRDARLGGFASTAERNDAIAAEYLTGSLSPEIAKRYRISRQRVWQILKTRGIKPAYKTMASGDAIIDFIVENALPTIEAAAAAMNTTANRIRARVSRCPRWIDTRRQMREWRMDGRKVALRNRVLEDYRKLKAELGRPATIQEMGSAKIFTTTLYRIYGSNYVSKFRGEVGEVS